MHRVLLALACLAAGCATDLGPDGDTVVVQRHQRTTRVVARNARETPSPRLVGEPNTPPVRMGPASPAHIQRSTLRRPAPAAAEIIVPQAPQVDVVFLQVGPPIVLDAPTPPPPADQPPPPLPAPVRTRPTAVNTPALETAEGLSYQNGGVNGTTGRLASPSPDLPTAEGLRYQP